MSLADGSSEILDGAKMIAAPEKALGLMTIAMIALAGSAVAFRM